MYKNKRVLAIIPARGGSKGVLRKNIRLVAGRPLIAWTIEEAKKSKYIDRVILSSDDDEIIKVARRWVCEAPFVRPGKLAEDNAPVVESVLHALDALNEEFDYLVLLQPTSPLRLAEDIDSCIEKCILEDAPACVAVTAPCKNPYWMYHVDGKGRLRPIIKQKDIFLLRQQVKNVYALNGAVYVAETGWFKKNKKFICRDTVAYQMPENRSIDIDTELDLRVCDMLLSGSGRPEKT